MTQQGFITAPEVQIVEVSDGRRGPRGPAGEGLKGDDGASIRVLGSWSYGTVYAPLDAVSWRSSAVGHVDSLYIQKTEAPASQSLLPPNEDLARWTEVGYGDWDSAFGGIWSVTQLNHGFTKVGQPVGYSYQADRYVLADARKADEIAIALVREVISADRVLLQSSGKLPNIDPDVLLPAGSWEPGRIYYTATTRGYLQASPPTDVSYYSNPILMAADAGGGGRNGIALPWIAYNGADRIARVTVGRTRYVFDLAGGETEITGEDSNAQVLAYTVGSNTQVYLNGVKLIEGANYTAADGSTITLLEAAPVGVLEVYTPDQLLQPVVPGTVAKLDNIEADFDGVTTAFTLTAQGGDVDIQNAMNVMVWMDLHSQEPDADFSVTSDGSTSTITFSAPPAAGTRFMAIMFMPVSGSGAPGGEVGVSDGSKGDVVVSGSGTIWSLSAAIKATFAPASLSATVAQLDDATSAALNTKMSKQAESSPLTYAATVDLNLEAITGTFRTLTLAGDVTFTTSNRAAVRQTTIIIDPAGAERNLVFPVDWTWLGAMPSVIPANTLGALHLSAFGADESDILATWSLEGPSVNTFWQSRLATTTAEEDLALLGFLDPPAEWGEGILQVVDDGAGNLIVEVTTLSFYGPDGADVAIADGGTGASTALGAVNNLTVGMASVPATDASTLTLDFATGRNFHVTKTLNGTLANPTNQVAGQAGSILFTQDATGSRTQAYGSHFIFPGGAPTLSTAPNVKDKLYYEVHAPGEIHATLMKDFKA